MPRYKEKLIDKNALVEALLDYTWRDEEGFLIESADEKRRFIERWLPDVPTVDAEPVVRCKDCKWYYIINGHNRCDLLDIEARDIKPDWFCADGERKEDNEF